MTLYEIWRRRDLPSVQVRAVRLNEDNVLEAASWSGAEVVEEIDPEHPEETQSGLNVRTPGGMARASLHDYLINYGDKFFVFRNRPFELDYEPVDRPNDPPESIAESVRQRGGFSDPFNRRNQI